MVDYISPTASLLESNTRADTANKDRASQEKMKTQELLGQLGNTGLQNKGAMDRTAVQGKQQELLATLRDQAALALQNLQEQEAGKRKEKELKAASDLKYQQDHFTITPNVAKGIKESFGMDMSSLEGKEVNAPLILALIAAKTKQDVADTSAESRKLAGTSEKDLQKELDTIERDSTTIRTKLAGMSYKGFPGGDIKTILNNISNGKLGKLTPEEESQVKIISGYINTMKSKQERANKIHSQLGTSQVDYTGFGLGDEEKQSYKSAQEVQAAYKSGSLTRDAAKKILQDQFGLK